MNYTSNITRDSIINKNMIFDRIYLNNSFNWKCYHKILLNNYMKKDYNILKKLLFDRYNLEKINAYYTKLYSYITSIQFDIFIKSFLDFHNIQYSNKKIFAKMWFTNYDMNMSFPLDNLSGEDKDNHEFWFKPFNYLIHNTKPFLSNCDDLKIVGILDITDLEEYIFISDDIFVHNNITGEDVLSLDYMTMDDYYNIEDGLISLYLSIENNKYIPEYYGEFFYQFLL